MNRFAALASLENQTGAITQAQTSPTRRVTPPRTSPSNPTSSKKRVDKAVDLASQQYLAQSMEKECHAGGVLVIRPGNVEGQYFGLLGTEVRSGILEVSVCLCTLW